MGIALRDVSEDVLYALAVVLSLPPDQLDQATDTGEIQPSASWLVEQEARITGLPHCLLVPPIPRSVTVKVSQAAKKVFMAASGGADNVAARAALNGLRLDFMLHPCATPTVLCQAHRKLHPALMREIFYYLSREVADHADHIRRHPRHDDDIDGNTRADGNGHDAHNPCQSRVVRDWGYRMMGISALWCTQPAFQALEQGRQVPSPGFRFSQWQQRSSSSHGAPSLPPPSSSARRIRSSMRMPHLDMPCEACMLAAVGARSQALIDLRAGMLSRLAEEAHDKCRRDKAKGRLDGDGGGGGSDELSSIRRTHLWLLLDAYINAFGDEVAAEIRHRSEVLAQTLYEVRICGGRRRRRLDREKRRQRKESGRLSYHHRPGQKSEKQPPRMVTKSGHRLPLPLLPLDRDPWAYNIADISDNSLTDDDDAILTPDDGAGDEPCYFVQGEEGDNQNGGDLNYYHGPAEADEAAAKPVPDWEEDYQRHMLDSETTFSSAIGRAYTSGCGDNDHGDGQESFVTISVHTEMPPRNGLYRLPPAAPSSCALPLSPIPGTPVTVISQASHASHTSQKSASARSTQSNRSTRSNGTAQPPRPQAPPPPASSVYSGRTMMTSLKRQQAVPQNACPTIYSDGNSQHSTARQTATADRQQPPPASSRTRPPPTTVGRAAASHVSRATAASRSRASRSTTTSIARTKTRPAASTVFVAPSTVRTPATPASYVALQADVAASLGIADDNDDGRTTATRATAATRAWARITAAKSSAKRTAKSTTSSTRTRAATEARSPMSASPPSRLSALSARVPPSDIYDDGDACSIAPSDSISIVADRRFEVERTKLEWQQRAHEKQLERLKRQYREQQERSAALAATSASATTRNLNQYRPADSRRPPPAATPKPTTTTPRRSNTTPVAPKQTTGPRKSYTAPVRPKQTTTPGNSSSAAAATPRAAALPQAPPRPLRTGAATTTGPPPRRPTSTTSTKVTQWPAV